MRRISVHPRSLCVGVRACVWRYNLQFYVIVLRAKEKKIFEVSDVMLSASLALFCDIML